MSFCGAAVLACGCGDVTPTNDTRLPQMLPPTATTPSGSAGGASVGTGGASAAPVTTPTDVAGPSFVAPEAVREMPSEEECNRPPPTAVIRDFRGSSEAGGHPDFEIDHGPPFANWPDEVTTGIVAPQLVDSKPVYAAATGSTYASGGELLVTSKETFDQWYRDTPGVNESFIYQIPFMPSATGSMVFESGANGFFPIDGMLFGNTQSGGVAYLDNPAVQAHNYHFTTELHMIMRYEDPMQVLTFSGDDDLWVFINNQLVLDLGGLHQPATGTITLGTIAAQVGMVLGEEYPFDMFHAERKVYDSNFRVETTFTFVNCNPIILLR